MDCVHYTTKISKKYEKLWSFTTLLPFLPNIHTIFVKSLEEREDEFCETDLVNTQLLTGILSS